MDLTTLSNEELIEYKKSVEYDIAKFENQQMAAKILNTMGL
jgi:hypothetical protein